ncbi:hypothetical protein BKY29_02760 [Weissella confusa]|uniref:DUF806 family protein n=1 Tax=Weissella confusa TaxID=1583 RepID=UPI0008FDEF80|nr:DUF806 family protein [Weissella confusa]OJF04157.1 hypothetical protein BKY29_02760 [Weissella confusa]
MTPVEEIKNVVHSVIPDWQVYFYAIPEEVIDNKNVTQVLISESNSDITTFGGNTFLTAVGIGMVRIRDLFRRLVVGLVRNIRLTSLWR